MEEYATAKQPPLLHTLTPSRRTLANRAFALVYTCAILAVLCRHAAAALGSATYLSFVTSATLFIADLVLGFWWFSAQAFRFRPVHRLVFPENLEKVLKRREFPPLDIFICTADPYKEPPMTVVNTALSVMAYDYPPEKISVYVSDDGGSQLTLFAFMEAARFASHWIPFCRKKEIAERCPEAFFGSNYSQSSETEQIKMLHQSMKVRVENVVEKGKIPNEFITSEQKRQVFSIWSEEFTRQDHPAIVQVLLEAREDRDITGQSMPNLVYLSREKSKTSSHHFKAGALNALLRVSAIMTNAPIILTLDCDMYSNDPKTPHIMLCFFCESKIKPNLGYVQFPQHFHGIDKHDIYANEFKRMFEINPVGLDGLAGPDYFGSGCFFWRRVFFGSPLSFVGPEIPELRPDHVVDGPIKAQPIMTFAQHVASCKYEEQTNCNWGAKLGFRYGSLVEDYYTGFRLHCEGWKSAFCNPKRPAFIGDAPITLVDALNQARRWNVGLLEVAISKYCPLTFGVKSMGLLMGLCYAYYAIGPILSIPITIYAFLPQFALLNGISIFPEVSDKWFTVYVFLFMGAYGQDCLDFMLAEGTFQKWWSDQRMWMLRGVTAHLFGSIEFASKHLGLATQGFSITSKVVDNEQSKRYDQSTFEFGVHSPMFVSLTMVAIINFIAFFGGLVKVFLTGTGNADQLFVQMFIAGFVVVNCWPVYDAMVLRTDKGRMPTKTTIISICLSLTLYVVASFMLSHRLSS
ncbi:cellulose synthase-like protein G3 isoform X1 [Diospyros lotus]|uniref:cellulose synthase-like protein G3 isoform X1 n=1 Tax=Diospyros lotus TaxID=55363 RepID=UPI0022513459|nr:cellulose synthase-like protein G3 isoform X1 [Diospyros lotus]